MRFRSPLFAPGDSERKMTKAIASAADAVILDLEELRRRAGRNRPRGRWCPMWCERTRGAT